MQSLKEHIYITERKEAIASLLEFIVFMEEGESLILSEARGESVKAGLSKVASKLGIAAHGRKNLLKLIASVGKNTGLALVYSIRAHSGNSEAKDKLTTILKTANIKSELTDLILRLDVLTLHLLTGPIHIIDALTGWHIGADLQQKAKTPNTHIKTALDTIVNAATKIKDKPRRTLNKSIEKIKKIFAVA
jgi:hypothetical protein